MGIYSTEMLEIEPKLFNLWGFYPCPGGDNYYTDVGSIGSHRSTGR